EPATGTLKTYTERRPITEALLNEPRIDRAGRYVGIDMDKPTNGLVVWDWQTGGENCDFQTPNCVLWSTTGDPGIPFGHNASLRRRWVVVDGSMNYPPDFAKFIPDVPDSGQHIGGPANSSLYYGNGNWIQHPDNLDDQWALFSHYGSLVLSRRWPFVVMKIIPPGASQPLPLGTKLPVGAVQPLWKLGAERKWLACAWRNDFHHHKWPAPALGAPVQHSLRVHLLQLCKVVIRWEVRPLHVGYERQWAK